MRFTIKLSVHTTSTPSMGLKIPDHDHVILEVCRTLGVREGWDQYGIWTSHAPTKQYFISIIPGDEGPIETMEQAVDCALTVMSLEVTISGNFNLWVKGRRYSTFEFKPTQFTEIYKEVLAEVDSDMAFNREEWGLTQKQRKC